MLGGKEKIDRNLGKNVNSNIFPGSEKIYRRTSCGFKDQFKECVYTPQQHLDVALTPRSMQTSAEADKPGLTGSKRFNSQNYSSFTAGLNMQQNH